MISRNTCTYRIHLRNETTMCHCSHYNIASSSFEGKLAKPEIVVAAVGSSQSLSFSLLAKMLNRSLTDRWFTLKPWALWQLRLAATLFQVLPLSLEPTFASNTPSPAIAGSIMKSFSSVHVMTDLPYKENVILMWESELTLPCHEA